MTQKKPTGKSRASARQKQALQARREQRMRRLRFLLPVGLVLLLIVIVAGDRLPGGSGGETVPQHLGDPDAPLASFFTREVRYWEDEIRTWAQRYQLNPNVIAILIQIESCGSPEVLSSVGAVGLMQVMPYYFDDGENMLNPDTNMRHGMFIFDECLNVFADRQVGVAAACYNGGASVTQRSYANWPLETRRYYDWVNGLWRDVVDGGRESDALEDWLQAGGSGLCSIAAEHLFSPVATAPDRTSGVQAGP